MNFWDVVAIFFWSFVFVAYLMLLFSIIGDLFRDRELNGWWKAVWIIFLVFVPFLTALIYVIARGRGMAQRQMEAAARNQADTEHYIRSVAATAPAASSKSAVDQIADAQKLLAAGAITQAEFDSLKQQALATPSQPVMAGTAR
jgi:hypothetical protein